MKHFSFKREAFLVVALLSAFCTVSFAAKTADDPIIKEKKDRLVDQAAVDAKKTAADILDKLLKTKKNTNEEPSLLLRKAEVLQEAAQIEFRIAHWSSMKSSKPVDLRAFKKFMLASVDSLDRLISAYPNYREIDRGYYLRAKAFKEVSEGNNAIRDFTFYIEKFPESGSRLLAVQSISEILMEKKEYTKAISYLSMLMKQKPNFRVFAYDKTSWCHYYNGDIINAMKYARLAYQGMNELGGDTKDFTVDKEKYLQNIALFYFTGFEKRLPNFSLENGLNVFKKVQSNGNIDSMVVYFAKLLRSKGMAKEYQWFVNNAVASDSLTAISKFDLLLANLEYFLNNQIYDEMLKAVDQVVAQIRKEKKSENEKLMISKAKSSFAESTTILQNFLEKNKQSSAEKSISKVLADFYQKLLDSKLYSSEEAGGIYFNFAELSFFLKNYEFADRYYRLAKKNNSSLEIRLKALAAQTEWFRLKGKIPQSLSATSITNAKENPLDEDSKEWIQEIDSLSSEKTLTQKMETFRFEAARLLYQNGLIKSALIRLVTLFKENPSSKYALPAASLALDTYLASEDWERSALIIREYRSVEVWKDNSAFQAKLDKLDEDVQFKKVESLYQRKDYDHFFTQLDAYLKIVGGGPKRNEILAMAANAALAKNDKKLAQFYFGKLKSVDGSRKGLDAASSLTDLSIAEEEFDYNRAAGILQDYFKKKLQSGSSIEVQEDLSKKLILYSWLSGGDRLRAALALVNCKGKLMFDCEIAKLRDIANFPEMLSKQTSEPRIQAAQNLFFLERQTGNNWRIKLDAITKVFETWPQLDSTTEFTLLSRFNSVLRNRLSEIRRAIKTNHPIRLDEKMIKNRLSSIEEFDEKVNALVNKVSWVSLNEILLEERSNLYKDLSSEIHAVPIPKGLQGADLDVFKQSLTSLSLPFEQKQEQIRKNIVLVAGKKLCCDMRSSLVRAETTKKSGGGLSFIKAYDQEKRPLMAFLIQEASSRSTIDSAKLKLFTAAALYKQEQFSEAFTNLEASYLEAGSPAYLSVPLIQSYWRMGDLEMSKKYLEQFSNSNAFSSMRFTSQEASDLKKIAAAVGMNGLDGKIDEAVMSGVRENAK